MSQVRCFLCMAADSGMAERPQASEADTTYTLQGCITLLTCTDALKAPHRNQQAASHCSAIFGMPRQDTAPIVAPLTYYTGQEAQAPGATGHRSRHWRRNDCV